MNCDHYHSLLSRYIDDEVTPRQRRELLSHVEGCPRCAAWLARVRQTNVLLKGLPQTQPSDRVRAMVLGSLKENSGSPDDSAPAQPTRHKRPTSVSKAKGLRLGVMSLLLRFDPSPRRIALATSLAFAGLLGMAYWMNLLPPLFGYDRLGFETSNSTVRTTVGATPIAALSSGVNGTGGIFSAPNLVPALPLDGAEEFGEGQPVRVRFDQPMDRASVEGAFSIDPPAAGAFTWVADNEMRFTPYAAGLLRGVTYTLSLSGTARSLTGTPLEEPAVWSFRTRQPYTVTTHLPSGATLPVTGSLTLDFGTAMDREDAGGKIALFPAWSPQEIPVTQAWDESGRTLTLSPLEPMPEGTVELRVDATARTQGGDTLGQPYLFTYGVELGAPRLRILGDHLRVSALPAQVEYEAPADGTGVPLPEVSFSLYALTWEQLSALAAAPGKQPAEITAGQEGVQAFRIRTVRQSGSTVLAEVWGVPPGIYLLQATAPPQLNTLTDWQILILTDGKLIPTGEGGPLWASDSEGKGWPGAEVSLFSPEGTLLERGVTDERGLWLPSLSGAGASLAVAWGAEGRLAATLLDAPERPGTALPDKDTLSASLQTDQPAYAPGEAVQFRALLRAPAPGAEATPVAEQEVSVSLLMPQGQPVATLLLKPDSVGGVSGSFPLSPNLHPGSYTLRVYSGGAEKDFSILVNSPPIETLSVLIAPSIGEALEAATAITRTVSVLGERGEPAVGALVTATLAILGDPWTSEPVTSTTGRDGRATVVLPLPLWLAEWNDPGLHMKVEVEAQAGRKGSDTLALDRTSQRSTILGTRGLVSPALGVASVAQPQPGGETRLRVVDLGNRGVAGDLLLAAYSPAGEHTEWSLHITDLGDVTLPLPAQYAGGRIRFFRGGVAGSRELELMPAQDPTFSLYVSVPTDVAPHAALPIHLGLFDSEGQPLPGIASVWFRRVSGRTGAAGGAGAAQGWKPAIPLQATGVSTHTLAAPGEPGLWYVLAEVATSDGRYAQAWSVVRVAPGPSIQLPPAQEIIARRTQPMSVVVHNPHSVALSTGVRATGEGGVNVLGGGSQTVDVPSGGRQRLNWQYVAGQPGPVGVAFTFMPSAGVAGAWRGHVHAVENPQTETTYASGVIEGEHDLKVYVPSGLRSEGLQLEIRASTSLLPALAMGAASLADGRAKDRDGEWAVLAAARLGAAASVSSAYRQAGALPSAYGQLSGVERSLLLQDIYSAQQDNGGWGSGPNVGVDGRSEITATAAALLGLRREQLAWAADRESAPHSAGNGGTPQPSVDSATLDRGLAYLHSQAARLPVEGEGSAAFDERAHALYVLSLYGALEPHWARLYMRYASSGDGGVKLSRRGQAWLALALLSTGATEDALVLVSSLAATEVEPELGAATLLLMVLAAADGSTDKGSQGNQGYDAQAQAYVRLIMESRQGAGWGEPLETADVLWALSQYTLQKGERPQPDSPTVTLNGSPVQTSGQPSDWGAISIAVSGNALHAGANDLRLRANTPGQALYYSLTLRATR